VKQGLIELQSEFEAHLKSIYPEHYYECHDEPALHSSRDDIPRCGLDYIDDVELSQWQPKLNTA